MIKNFKNKGFTLIELLVVIAIIGILSSVVLASLGTARTKGKIASATGSMSSMRAQAELGNNNGSYLTDLCTSASTNVGSLSTLVAAAGTGQGFTVVCNQNTAAGTAPTAWAAEVDFGASQSPRYFCVDSSGFSGSRTLALASGTTATCPAS